MTTMSNIVANIDVQIDALNAEIQALETARQALVGTVKTQQRAPRAAKTPATATDTVTIEVSVPKAPKAPKNTAAKATKVTKKSPKAKATKKSATVKMTRSEARDARLARNAAARTAKSVSATPKNGKVVSLKERGDRKRQILSLLAKNMPAAKIAETLGTHVGYVYTVKRNAA